MTPTEAPDLNAIRDEITTKNAVVTGTAIMHLTKLLHADALTTAPTGTIRDFYLQKLEDVTLNASPDMVQNLTDALLSLLYAQGSQNTFTFQVGGIQVTLAPAEVNAGRFGLIDPPFLDTTTATGSVFPRAYAEPAREKSAVLPLDPLLAPGFRSFDMNDPTAPTAEVTLEWRNTPLTVAEVMTAYPHLPEKGTCGDPLLPAREGINTVPCHYKEWDVPTATPLIAVEHKLQGKTATFLVVFAAGEFKGFATTLSAADVSLKPLPTDESAIPAR